MTSLLSWGHYPAYHQTPHPCSWRGDITDTISDLINKQQTTLPYGLGRSYGDSCLAVSDHVLQTLQLNRYIQADWDRGVIVAEAGLSLDDILKLAIPNGWFLPVTPGTKFVTLGGAIANDVHGKNHHLRGTFGCHVKKFGLVRSDGSYMICSTDENAEYFAATIGGLGLTGVIDFVELQLVPVKSSIIDSTNIRFGSLDEFFAISAELDDSHEFTVAWIDCLAKGKSVGRGIYMLGNSAEQGPLVYNDKRKLNVPVTVPVSLINPLSLRLFNSTYYRVHKAGRHSARVDYEPFFYPLDRVLNWNRIYGPRGFQQYQCVIPEASAADAAAELLAAIAGSNQGSFLAVLKRFGQPVSPGLLSFPVPGATLALDFPQKGESTERLFSRLDSIVRDAGGRLYPAKDAHMSSEDFRAAYPAWEQLESLRDPALLSRFWQRVTTGKSI